MTKTKAATHSKQASDPILAENASAIRVLGKRALRDVIEIGRRLTDCKARVGHGNWLPWLDREFGWSDQTARNFMRVHELGLKSKRLLNLDVSVDALYLLAASSTPEEVREQVVERAETGEKLTSAEVRRTIREMGGPTATSDRINITTTPVQERSGERRQFLTAPPAQTGSGGERKPLTGIDLHAAEARVLIGLIEDLGFRLPAQVSGPPDAAYIVDAVPEDRRQTFTEALSRVFFFASLLKQAFAECDPKKQKDRRGPKLAVDNSPPEMPDIPPFLRREHDAPADADTAANKGEPPSGTKQLRGTPSAPAARSSDMERKDDE
jgi:hypothetical protein